MIEFQCERCGKRSGFAFTKQVTGMFFPTDEGVEIEPDGRSTYHYLTLSDCSCGQHMFSTIEKAAEYLKNIRTKQ